MQRQQSQHIICNYVERACDPSQFEPNLAIALELADYINSKKANTAREAAVEIVRMINHRNLHVGMLALSALDILVKNCGYAFHLQLATKDFLNELVKKFPERPPPIANMVMAKILELIHEWRSTLCVRSKYKEDLVHIRDMHRLLAYKGYRFPEGSKKTASVLTPNEALKSPEELEEEDRAAQAAKLQELIRRGTPKDLAAANDLMKVMTGFDQSRKPDYKTQTKNDLERVQGRAILLNDMLNNTKPGERFVDGDAYEQTAQSIMNVQPKLQQWIGQASETDPESVDRLLLINDLINGVLKRYAAFKKGDFSEVVDLHPNFANLSKSNPAAIRKQVDLINFDEELHIGSSLGDQNAQIPHSTQSAIENHLGGLPTDLLFQSSAPSPGTSIHQPKPTEKESRTRQPLDLTALYRQESLSGGSLPRQHSNLLFDMNSGSHLNSSTNANASQDFDFAGTQTFGAISLSSSSPSKLPNSTLAGSQIPLSPTPKQNPGTPTSNTAADVPRQTPTGADPFADLLRI